MSEEAQNYYITPEQEWIHGVHAREDLVRQFQVLEKDSE